MFLYAHAGLIYGESYLSSNFNIIVPIIIHAIYSLVSMYVTWYFGTLDLRQRIQIASKSVKAKTEDVQTKFEVIAKAVRRLSRDSFTSYCRSVIPILFFFVIYCS